MPGLKFEDVSITGSMLVGSRLGAGLLRKPTIQLRVDAVCDGLDTADLVHGGVNRRRIVNGYEVDRINDPRIARTPKLKQVLILCRDD
jgi:hypothetical protein